MSEEQTKYIELAHTLPSLAIMYMKIPLPMTAEDFDVMVRTIETWKRGIMILSEPKESP